MLLPDPLIDLYCPSQMKKWIMSSKGARHHFSDWPKAGIAVVLLLVDINGLPGRLDVAAVLPEVDEESDDFARWRQESLQVARVVALKAEAPRRDDRCAELQAQLQTGRVQQRSGTHVLWFLKGLQCLRAFWVGLLDTSGQISDSFASIYLSVRCKRLEAPLLNVILVRLEPQCLQNVKLIHCVMVTMWKTHTYSTSW